MKQIDIKIRSSNPDDAKTISDLALSLQNYFSVLSPSEAAAFFLTLSPEATKERLKSDNFSYYIAENKNTLCGVVGLRDASHIYHLFVTEQMHGKGVGRVLYNHIKTLTNQKYLTVNSSRYAVPFYKKLGFFATNDEQIKDGLIYLPMKIQL